MHQPVASAADSTGRTVVLEPPVSAIPPAADGERWIPSGADLAVRRAGIRALHDYLRARPAEVVSILTEFSVHRAARYEIDAAVRTLAGAFDEIERYRPTPVARLAALMPSNVVLFSYVLYLMVPSLFVRRLQFRPASQVKEQTLALHRVLAPVHRLPIEVCPVSQRAFTRDCVADADVVVFTGSYQNAEKLRRQVRPDQLFVYQGAGINPFVVAPRADLARAVRDAVDIRMLNSGQDCLAPDILLVSDSDVDHFVDLLIRRLKALRYGPYEDPNADYGPIFYDGALETAALYLCRHRANIVYGGEIDFRSRRLEPAVLVSDLCDRPTVEEFFTPVFNVVRYRDVDELLQTLGSGVFAERALGASVYGPAPKLVEALRRWHTVTVNSTLIDIDNGNEPFGGYGPMANYVACRGGLRVAPVLISHAVAEHLGHDRQHARRPMSWPVTTIDEV